MIEREVAPVFSDCVLLVRLTTCLCDSYLSLGELVLRGVKQLNIDGYALCANWLIAFEEEQETATDRADFSVHE